MRAIPLFGTLSGFCTSIGLAPHLLALAVLLATGLNPPVISLIVFTIGAKILAEWLFWTKSADRMSEYTGRRRVLTNHELLSHPNVWVSLLAICIDALSEATLIFVALKTSISPPLILFAFLGCQVLSAPIQGAVSDCFSQKKSLVFALVISMVAIAAAGAVSLDGTTGNSTMYHLIDLLYLHPFTPAVQMILILCVKGLLGNTTVVARSVIVEVIKHKTIGAA